MKVAIWGESPAVQELKGLIQTVAHAKTNILVIGESGTGKELVARMIHESGPFADKPFVPVNCGAIPEGLMETEMFGHHKGSFTGAVSDKQGLFEVANGGTLFLDEIGELPLSIQVKLLRALQERKIRKVGGLDDIRVDVRIIAATNRDLEAAVAKGTFREDLYYRLNVILIKTPALRDRPGDVRILSQRFLKTLAERAGKAIEGLSEEVLLALESYTWPGNVRELENVMERAVTLENGNRIGLHSLPVALQSIVPTPTGGAKVLTLPAPVFDEGALDLDKILSQVERVYLLAALERAGGVRKKAAQLLGITFRSIRYRLEKQGL